MTEVKKEKLFTTIADATRYVRNMKGRVRFQLMVHAFLPTEEGRGFNGTTCISVSRSQFVQALEGMGTTLVDQRGGKIKLRITKSSFDSTDNSLIFVSLY